MCLLSMMAAAPAMSDDFKRARKDADDDSAHKSLVGGRLVASVATDVSLRNSEWTVSRPIRPPGRLRIEAVSVARGQSARFVAQRGRSSPSCSLWHR